MKCSVIGNGGWGTALGLGLFENGHEVRIWGHDPEEIAETLAAGENRRYLPGVRIPPGLAFSADRRAVAAGAELAVLVVPSRHYRAVMASFRGLLPAGARLVSATKGLEAGSLLRMTQVAEDELGAAPVAALSGPSHAEEVARGIPTALVVASPDEAAAGALQRVFSRPTLRVYTSDDVAGVELGGALKNVIAIAAGVSDGIGFGDNTKAALLTRGLAEITRLGVAAGAHPATFAGLSGLGDLMVTCASRHSRNRAVGERLGRGEKLEAILASMAMVAEGVWTCRAALELAARHRVSAPITAQVCALVHEGRDPRQAVQELMTRDLRSERD